MNFSDEQVAAFVDGELDEVTSTKIARAADSDPGLASRIAAEQSLRNALGAHFEPMLEDAVPDRLTSLLTNVDTSFAERLADKQDTVRQWRTGFQTQHWGAIAASLVVGVLVGNFALSQPQGLVESRSDGLVAAGELEQALESQLASAQTGAESVQIRLTFEDEAGSTCRSFEQATLSGIACKHSGEWQIRRSFEGTARTEYRQASSTALLEAVSTMMSGEAFDATAESAAMQAGWGE